MQSILKTCQPRPDILTGSFNPEIFTASLSQVMDGYRGRAAPIHNLYTEAESFFRDATYPTEGLRLALTDVFGRLAGDHTVPASHRLETAFGGGKTHTLIALAHLGFRGHDLAAVTSDLVDTRLLQAPEDVTVVGVAGDEIPVHKPHGTELVPYTLWGEMAYQVGGDALYHQVESDATSYAAPGRNYFEQVLGHRKVLIMLDELAQYAARLETARPNGGDQLAAFLMGLHGYARTHASISVVLTLASQADAFARQTRRLTELIAAVRGQEVTTDEALGMAQRAETGIRSVVARDAVTVIPVQAAEISRVLARRLFVSTDPNAARSTADLYMEMYRRNADMLSDQATREDFRATMVAHYPLHPTFIAFLNQKLATLETFHGTRGVLRVLALAIRRLWNSQVRDLPMLHTCHLDLRDLRTTSEIIGRTGSSDLLPVLNTDVGGPDTATLETGRSRAELADRKNPHPAGFPLHEYTWKAVFLHSLVGRAEGLGSNLFGITAPEALFEIAFPGMTPPQVETALHEIEGSDGAYYLRFSQGRYYASLDPSETRALASIRTTLPRTEVEDLLAATARKVVRSEAGTFEVVHDVAAPEHVPDKTRRPVLALVALNADQIDAEAIVTTAGPNRPRLYQNFVFLLIPETVHVTGEVWKEDRVIQARAVRHRLEEITGDVLARRKLSAQPENHGITAARLAEKDFDTRLTERELALQSVVTQAYNAVWFPSAAGQVSRRDIKTAGGESGAPVIEEIRRLLQDEGELMTADQAATQETLLSLAKLFFNLGQTPTLENIREHFVCNRGWPVLEQPSVLGPIVRAGVERGVWCLFRMGSPESVKPAAFFSRDAGDLPLDLDPGASGWSLVTLQGARQRGWAGPLQVDPYKIESWVANTLAREGPTSVTQLAQKVVEQHGDVPENAVIEAVQKLRQTDRLMTYSGQPEQHDRPPDLKHGTGAILQAVQPDEVVIGPAEAARRGWVSVAANRFILEGQGGARTLVPLLARLGSFYTRGASSTIKSLDLVDLQVRAGGCLRLSLENVQPEAMKQLGELFETLATVIQQGDTTEAYLEIDDPDDQCLLIQALQPDGQP
ncbi:hypothetical protein NKDENANG_03233 [Candidatus Entotheonellaceae bacterium PAL068K]